MRNSRQVPVFVVTLDALGTLYGFRKPVSVQYQEVAQQCGLKGLDPKKLDSAFRSTFKHYNSAFPNYGKGKLANPEEWWTKLVEDAFGQVVVQPRIPKDLGTKLYRHFSSSSAYVLFPDTKLFLQSMRALRSQFLDRGGPLISIGVVTNSDPRVRSVLEAMQIRVGCADLPECVDGAKMDDFKMAPAESSVALEPRSLNFWDPRNDFDFLVTSYDANSEKPDSGIWRYAANLPQTMVSSRSTRSVKIDEREFEISSLDTKASLEMKRTTIIDKNMGLVLEDVKFSAGELRWIHIGDEYSKDYEGARDFGLEALHLDRSGKQLLDDSIQTISSLEEAAMIVNMMAQDHFTAHPVKPMPES